MAQIIICATAGIAVEQRASHPRIINLSRGGIFEFFEAAASTPVAQGFPLPGGELVQGFVPPKRIG